MTMIIVAMKGQQELMDLFIMFIILGEGKGPGLTMSFEFQQRDNHPHNPCHDATSNVA